MARHLAAFGIVALVWHGMCFTEVSTLDPCADVHPDSKQTEWECQDFSQRTSTKPGTLEHSFSMLAGAIFNATLSVFAWFADLVFMIIVNIWHATKVVVVHVWNWMCIAIEWMWAKVVDYAELSPSLVEAVWKFWYPDMWKWIVIAAFEEFFLLVVPAFIFYVLWAILGVPVCLIMTLVLFALVVLFALLAALCTVVVFASAVIAFIIIAIVVLFIFAVVIALAVLVFLALSFLGVVFLSLILGIVLCIGIALFTGGWLLIATACAVLILPCLAALSALVAHLRRQKQRKEENNNNKAKPEERRWWQLCWEREFSKRCLIKGFLNAVALSVMACINIVIFIKDINLLGASTITFARLNFLSDGSEGTNYLEVNAMGDMDRAFRNLYKWSFMMASRFQEWYQWQCPGATAGFVTSQLVVVQLIIWFLKGPPVLLKSLITDLSVKSEPHTLTNAAVFGIRTLIITLIEFMAASGSGAFYLLLKPKKKGQCDYEGDIIITVLMYGYLIVTCCVSLLLLGHTCIAVKGFNVWPRENNSRGCGNTFKSIITSPMSFGKVVWQNLKECPHTLPALCYVIFGRWTMQAVKLAGLGGPEVEPFFQIGEMGSDGSQSVAAVHWPLKHGTRRNQEYILFTAQMTSSALQVLPLGGILGRLTSCSNAGFVWTVGNVEAEFPEKQELEFAEKSCAWARFFFLLCINLMCWCRVREFIVVTVVYVGVATCIVETICQTSKMKTKSFELDDAVHYHEFQRWADKKAGACCRKCCGNHSQASNDVAVFSQGSDDLGDHARHDPKGDAEFGSIMPSVGRPAEAWS